MLVILANNTTNLTLWATWRPILLVVHVCQRVLWSRKCKCPPKFIEKLYFTCVSIVSFLITISVVLKQNSPTLLFVKGCVCISLRMARRFLASSPEMVAWTSSTRTLVVYAKYIINFWSNQTLIVGWSFDFGVWKER